MEPEVIPTDFGKLVLDEMPGGATGRIVLVNAQAEKLFGYNADELCGQPVEMLQPPHKRGLYSAERAA